ncbi:MAG: alpha/beta fold hydrolase [Cytophagales bacterium]|nr:MAG: alpha/beta fold hydrolase [Cytophagales bacterium]
MPISDINGIKMYYEMQGQGEPLLLLHGLGSSSIDWEMQIPFLAQHFRVIVPDLRGHGKSEKPYQKYSVPLFADDVWALLKHLQIEKVHIVGLSMGGMIAFQMAADQPEKLQAMVILNSAPQLKIKTLKHYALLWQRKILMQLFGLKTLSKVLAKRLFPKPEQQPLRDLFYQRWIQNDKKAYYQAFLAIVNWGVEEKIAQMQTPTLILAADRDYTPVEFKQEYAKQMPNAQLQVIKDSGHATPMDQPEQLNQAILLFLKNHSS